MVAGLFAFTGFVSLAVDYARIQLSKTELTTAVDSAAMAGACLVKNGAYYSRPEAVHVAGLNIIGGKPLTLQNNDVVVGKWNAVTRTIDTTSDTPDAVQVTGILSKSRNSAIPLMLTNVVSSYRQWEATETATAVWVAVPGVYKNIQATANPFLAGMKKNATASEINPHNSPDKAGDESSDDISKQKQSPTTVGLPVAAGMTFKFDSISGDARHDPNLPYFQPDGEMADIGHNNLTTSDANSKGSTFYHQNGIHDVVAPINALVGVFLTDEAPDKTAVPTINDRYNADCPTDFTNSAERNRTVYQPKLKQIFFIGDGMTDDLIRQTFVAPAGATRLYLATWDFYEWNNNAGSRLVQINGGGYVQLVK